MFSSEQRRGKGKQGSACKRDLMSSGDCSFNRTASTLFTMDGAVALGDGTVERFVGGGSSSGGGGRGSGGRGGGGGSGGGSDNDVSHFVIEADGAHVTVRGTCAWGAERAGHGEARGGG